MAPKRGLLCPMTYIIQVKVQSSLETLDGSFGERSLSGVIGGFSGPFIYARRESNLTSASVSMKYKNDTRTLRLHMIYCFL